MKRFVFLLILFILVISCNKSPNLKPGSWLGALTPDTSRPEIKIPFVFDLNEISPGSWSAVINNAEEQIEIDEITVNGDSIHFFLPWFEGTIDALNAGTSLQGSYTHRGSGRSWTIPFTAKFGIADRFPESNDTASANITGRWEISVNPASTNPEKQIAEFCQVGNRVTGSILTVTGDYRFLEGKLSGNLLQMSAFDGAHALIILADLSASGTLENGFLCGGPTWKTTWRAFRNDTVTLPDPTTLTWLKPGYDKLDFAFQDTEGKTISINDTDYHNRPVIVQIIGSWCPNCKDETLLMTKFYQKYHDNGLDIIALCFESDNYEESTPAIRRFKSGLNAPYSFLYAGESNKRKAAESLPMLNRILSYPTAIFLDRKHNVKRIYTGFTGPGTGKHYDQLSQDMEHLILEILE